MEDNEAHTLKVYSKNVDNIPNGARPLWDLTTMDRSKIEGFERVKLDFSSTLFSTHIIQQLSFLLINSKSVSSLEMNLYGSGVSDNILSDFTHPLAKIAGQLQDFDLNLGE